MEIQNAVKEFLYEDHLEQEFKDLEVNDSLLESGIIDSVKMLDLISFLEDTYKIEVDDDDLYPENFDTLNAIAEYVNGKK